jgi:hypothetical protein
MLSGLRPLCGAASLVLNFPYLFSGYQADDLISSPCAGVTRCPTPVDGPLAAPFSAIDGFQALWGRRRT